MGQHVSTERKVLKFQYSRAPLLSSVIKLKPFRVNNRTFRGGC